MGQSPENSCIACALSKGAAALPTPTSFWGSPAPETRGCRPAGPPVGGLHSPATYKIKGFDPPDSLSGIALETVEAPNADDVLDFVPQHLSTQPSTSKVLKLPFKYSRFGRKPNWVCNRVTSPVRV